MDPQASSDLIQAAVGTVAVARLIHLNLAKRFPALLAYLIFLAAINVVYGLLNQASKGYYFSYVVLEPVECIFSIFAVRELFALTFDDYPGIRTVGRWVMYGGVALALGLSLLFTGFFWTSRTMVRGDARLYYVEVSKRPVVFTLAFVIVTILIFLSKYPLHLSRNTLVSSVFFSVLFLSEAARLIVDSLAPQLHNVYVDLGESAFTAICLVGWAALLRPEPSTAPTRVTFSTPQEDHLLQQLNSLNQLMTRAARR